MSHETPRLAGATLDPLDGFESIAEPATAAADTPGSDADATPTLEQIAALLAGPPSAPQPVTRWPGQADLDEGFDLDLEGQELFLALCALLEGRRSLVGKLGGKTGTANARSDRVASADELQRALVRLQSMPPTVRGGRPRASEHVKQDLLAQLRLASPLGDASAIPAAEVDAIDLVGLLLEHIGKELRPNSPALPLLQRLQIPLVRVALREKRFFTQRQHPARRLLNLIAETSEFLSPADPGDQPMLERMKGAVDRAGDYSGDPALFADLHADLTHHLQTQARKAEVAERRHVEAALGREKLEQARLRAAAALDELLAGARAPRFVRTLLSQAWSDVLALALLRGGEESEPFRRQMHTAQRLLEIAAARRLGEPVNLDAEESQSLRQSVETALVQVGYHVDDAAAVATRLVTAAEIEDDDTATSTELALRLKKKVRLGQELDGGAAAPAELDAAARAALQRIGELGFGTWFEFRQANGGVERRRLSWFNLASGHCLFVNHRGHKLADCSLPWLATEMAGGRASVLLQPAEPIVDRAWAAIVRALHSFAGNGEQVPS